MPAASPTAAAQPGPSAARLHLVSGVPNGGSVEKLVALRLRVGREAHLRFLRSRLRSREDAEDVLQDFALKALQGAGRLTDAGKVDAWLSVTLRNALFDRYRRNAGRARLQEAVSSEPGPFAEETDDLERPLACLAAAMSDLKPQTAALLRRAEIEETGLRQVAADLGITPNNAGVRVHRAREALRKVMKSTCAACPSPCALAASFVVRAAA